MENNIPSATHQEKAKKMKKLRRWQIAVSLLGVAIIVWGVIEVVCLFLNYSQTETSNDAQIEQYVSPINLRASGYIDKIYFTEHQEVHKGDTLMVLDDREYKIRVMEAEAALKDAQAGATIINATLNTTQTTASVYDASIAEIEVRLAKLEKDRKRYENLVKRNSVPPGSNKCAVAGILSLRLTEISSGRYTFPESWSECQEGLLIQRLRR